MLLSSTKFVDREIGIAEENMSGNGSLGNGNFTENITRCNELTEGRLPGLVVLLNILFLPIVYLLIALLGYGLRKLLVRRRDTQTIINVRFNGHSKFVLFLLILVQLTCLVRQIAAVFFSDGYYTHIQYFNLTTGIGYHFISIILWARQQQIYQKPGIRRMATPKVKYFSYFALFCICISIVAITINEVLFATEETCEELIKMAHRIIWLVMLAFDVVFQIILFALFAHPLLEHKRQMKQANISSFRTLRPALLKIFYAAIACFIANIILGVTLTTLKIRGLGTTISSLSLFLQTIAIIASYSDWRVRLFPFIYCTKNGKSIFPANTTNNKPSVVSETLS